jgi:DNA-directed RNA polymerase subunit H (RpoH/RPB5)
MSKVIVVCKEMFQARGYVLYEETAQENGYFLKARNQKRAVWCCILPSEGKFNVEMLKTYYQFFTTHSIQHVLLVHHDGMTPSVKKAIHDMDMTIELFSQRELTYNILKHELVPRHTVIGHSKRNDQKLPLLRRTDPVARFLAFRVGDIVQIDRPDGTLYIRYVK